MKINVYPRSLLEQMWQEDQVLFTPNAKNPPLCLRCGKSLSKRLVVNALSRHADAYICSLIDNLFVQMGVRFISLAENVDSYLNPDSVSNIIVPITNVMNDNYCYQTSKKIRQVFDYKRRNGQYIGSFAPYCDGLPRETGRREGKRRVEAVGCPSLHRNRSLREAANFTGGLRNSNDADIGKEGVSHVQSE